VDNSSIWSSSYIVADPESIAELIKQNYARALSTARLEQWLAQPKIRLWEGVALLCGIDPDNENYDLWRSSPPMLARIVLASDPKALQRFAEEPVRHAPYATVRTLDFFSWAVDVLLPLPAAMAELIRDTGSERAKPATQAKRQRQATARSSTPGAQSSSAARASLPPDGLVRLDQVLALLQVSKASFYRHKKADGFPAPVKMGKAIQAWRSQDIRDWLERKQTGTPPCATPTTAPNHAKKRRSAG
jgi:predicted DNA-binding transcriptional regulator AlpA